MMHTAAQSLSKVVASPAFRTVDGVSIRFMESDQRNADALLLSPWPESVFAYEPIWSRLAETTHLVAVDLPGFGRSEGKDTFRGQAQFTPWDDLDVAYFSGEAFYTYINTPFLCTYEEFFSEEIAPIQVGGETWRRLKVTFPDTVKSHTKTQIFCFGPDGLLRRHDYHVDILGGPPGFNYASDYRNVDGILFPTKRLVYAHEVERQPTKEPLLIDIKMGDITIAYSSVAV